MIYSCGSLGAVLYVFTAYNRRAFLPSSLSFQTPSYINQGILSSSPFQKAQAILLLGFMNDREALQLLDSQLATYPDTWVRKLLERSQQTWQKNDWAMHWFRSFVESDEDTTAWASLRLFLGCVDSRFWHWRSQVERKQLGNLNRERLAFLENNLGVLKRRIRENEELFSKHYLGAKILMGQGFPWM